jgi:hypothetical protein
MVAQLLYAAPSQSVGGHRPTRDIRSQSSSYPKPLSQSSLYAAPSQFSRLAPWTYLVTSTLMSVLVLSHGIISSCPRHCVTTMPCPDQPEHSLVMIMMMMMMIAAK